ncbi:MAG: tetratricopeptide repeat protein [Betaproteobacteria bacterium]|nr:tetratricopeptide repeat protein [Betaproteobacteria bacterium]
MSADSASGRKWLLPALAVGITVVGGGGWYVWSELNRISKPAAMANRPATPVMPQPAAISPTVPPQPTTAATPPEPPAVVAEAPLPPLLPPAIDQPSVPVPSAAVAAGIARGLDEREALAKALKQIPPSGDAPVTLKLTRSIAPTAVSTELSAAYQSLKEGNYAVAVTRYSNLVQSEPLNTDAHLGLATAFARNGDAVAAARHFRAVLAIDPRNTGAIAGLMSINRTGPESTEVEIKTLLSKFPESAALHFALGNRLASDRRWVEAQQAYFEAYRLDATRADYVYNLAVSLDQLGKQILARDYYSKALAMPVDAGGQFDKAVVARRLRELAVASER